MKWGSEMVFIHCLETHLNLQRVFAGSLERMLRTISFGRIGRFRPISAVRGAMAVVVLYSQMKRRFKSSKQIAIVPFLFGICSLRLVDFC